MLHIITPLFRYENLTNIYQSIPNYDDIQWHISKSIHRKKLDEPFIYADPRIKLYEVDCSDTDIITKRNTVFSQIQDGYFYLLDDDTYFLDEVYRLYGDYSKRKFKGMIIGNQSYLSSGDNKASLPSINPEQTRGVDTGMVLCYHAVLANVQYAPCLVAPLDAYFWSRCFAYYGADNVTLVNRTISVYNYWGPKIRVRKRLFALSIRFDIYNVHLARWYQYGSCTIDIIRILVGKQPVTLTRR